ncbi:MAG: L,D-transpeptidase family protein [Akkermansia sp.]|nr:L,D-transpeptidase family protein [Akkermansia sp.]
MKKQHLFATAALAAILASCSQVGPSARVHNPIDPMPQVAVPTYLDFNPLDIQGKNLPTYKNPFPAGTYEHFVAMPSYPTTMDDYCDEKLLGKLNANNSKIIICLPQQRARVYVEGRVAMDWPISTGTNGHETPTGTFRIIEKKEEHQSNRYGRFVNANGKTTNSNADTANGIPEGQSFIAAPMPYWHRLTLDGVGLHVGKVVPGKRLSHGCIRSPRNAIKKFYEYSVLGMPAYISRAIEDYNRGGAVRSIDVKYRPSGDHTDMAPGQTVPQSTPPAAVTQTH